MELKERLQKLAGIDDIAKKIPVKKIAQSTIPLTGEDIIGRFKNVGVFNVQKESGFIFLADENRITENDATLGATPSIRPSPATRKDFQSHCLTMYVNSINCFISRTS